MHPWWIAMLTLYQSSWFLPWLRTGGLKPFANQIIYVDDKYAAYLRRTLWSTTDMQAAIAQF
jgi:hypothetical protein